MLYSVVALIGHMLHVYVALKSMYIVVKLRLEPNAAKYSNDVASKQFGADINSDMFK